MPPPAATQAAARLWTARVTNPPHLPAFLKSVESMTPPAVQTRFTRGRVRELKNGHNSVTVQNRTHIYMNFFHHKGLGNHLLQLCPKVVKHPVYLGTSNWQTSVNSGISMLLSDSSHGSNLNCLLVRMQACESLWNWNNVSAIQRRVLMLYELQGSRKLRAYFITWDL